MSFLIRAPAKTDPRELQELYKEVTLAPCGGLARRPYEITSDFIADIFLQSSRSGLMLVLEETRTGKIVGAIHAIYGDIESLRHVMGQLTILIHPEFQKLGLGERLFSKFLLEIETRFPFIMRVELRALVSNASALRLYESLGFVREGRFEGRILAQSGEYVDGIPMAWRNPSWQKTSSVKTLSGVL